MTDKASLRKKYLQKRAALSFAEERTLNGRLFTRFKTYPLTGIRYLHCFLPIEKFKEVDTWSLLDWVIETQAGIKIVLSRSNLQTHLMEHFVWEGATGEEHLKVNAWGITEPTGGLAVLPQQIDAVLMPLLAFDLEGNRAGYGKGFYDRFLSECRPDCQKIGLSFFPPDPKITGVDPHDQKLDACITPEKIYYFESSVSRQS